LIDLKAPAYVRILPMGVKVDLLRCVGCGDCVLECPVGVLYIEDMKCRVEEGCISCGICVDRCHWHAITLVGEPVKKKD
jgi:ferredoxin